MFMARITKAEAAEIARLRRNAQAKVRRLAKLGVSTDLLPAIPKVDSSQSRAQVNRTKAVLKGFTDRGNERWQYVQLDSGAVVPKKYITEYEKEKARVNSLIKKREDRFKDEPFKLLSERGTGLGGYRTVGEDSVQENARYYSKDARSFKTLNDLIAQTERLKKYNEDWLQQHDEQWRENTIKAIENVYGKESVSGLVDYIREMNIKEFVYLMTTQDINIGYVYTDSQQDSALEELKQYFEYV